MTFFITSVCHQNSGTTDSLVSSRKSSNASSTGKERRKAWLNNKQKHHQPGEFSAFDEYYADVEVPSNENYQKPRSSNISAVLDPKSVNKPPVVKRRQSIAQKMMGSIGRRVSSILSKDELLENQQQNLKQEKFRKQSRNFSIFRNCGNNSPRESRCDLPGCLSMPSQNDIIKPDKKKSNKPESPQIIKPERGDTKTTYSMSDKLGVLRVERMLPEFKGLNKVYLSNMSLKALPEAFEGLVSVQTLALDNNKFKTIPRVVTKLKQLKCLYMNNNKVDTLPSSVRDLASLRYFWLQNNRLTSLPYYSMKAQFF